MNPIKAVTKAIAQELRLVTVYNLPTEISIDPYNLRFGSGNRVIINMSLVPVRNGAKAVRQDVAIDVGQDAYRDLMFLSWTLRMLGHSLSSRSTEYQEYLTHMDTHDFNLSARGLKGIFVSAGRGTRNFPVKIKPSSSIKVTLLLEDQYARGSDFATGSVPNSPVRARLSVSSLEFTKAKTLKHICDEAIKANARKLERDTISAVTHEVRMVTDEDYRQRKMHKFSIFPSLSPTVS
jgi:hypothetical protein